MSNEHETSTIVNTSEVYSATKTIDVYDPLSRITWDVPESQLQTFKDSVERSVISYERQERREKFMADLVEQESPWLPTINLMNTNYYKDQQKAEENNYAAAAVMKWQAGIEKQVDKLVDQGAIGTDQKGRVIEITILATSKLINAHLESTDYKNSPEAKKGGVNKLLTAALPQNAGESPKNSSDLLKAHIKYIADDEKNQNTEIKPVATNKIPAGKKLIRLGLVTAIVAGAASVAYLASKAKPASASQNNATASETYNDNSATPINSKTSTPSPSGTVHAVLPPGLTTKQSDQISQPQRIKTRTPESIDNTEIKIAPATPEPLFVHAGIDFSAGQQMTLTLDLPPINLFDFSNQTVNASYLPVVHNDLNTPKENKTYWTSVAPGMGTAGVHIEKYGNTIVNLHSGRLKGIELEAEGIRKWLQGGSPDKPEDYVSREETIRRLHLLEGLTGTQEMEDGTKSEVKVISVGIVPHGELNDKLYGDAKEALGTVIEAANDQSRPKFIKFQTERGVFYILCIHNIDLKDKDPNWANWESVVIGITPTNESIHTNELKSAQEQANQPLKSELESSAELLARIINEARMTKHGKGSELEKYIYGQLKAFGIPVDMDMRAMITDTKNETQDGDKVQCLQAVALLATFPKSENVPDLNGWKIWDEAENAGAGGLRGIKWAKEYLMSEAGKMDEELLRGDKISRANTQVFKIDSLIDYSVGDTFVTGASLYQPEGHMGIITEETTHNGRVTLKVFYVDGTTGEAVTTEVTEENMYQVLAFLPKGQKVDLFAIRKIVPEDEVRIELPYKVLNPQTLQALDPQEVSVY